MSNRVQLQIDSELLCQLLTEGNLSVADFSCLDSHSKQSVHRMYLAITQSQLGGICALEKG